MPAAGTCCCRCRCRCRVRPLPCRRRSPPARPGWPGLISACCLIEPRPRQLPLAGLICALSAPNCPHPAAARPGSAVPGARIPRDRELAAGSAALPAAAGAATPGPCRARGAAPAGTTIPARGKFCSSLIRARIPRQDPVTGRAGQDKGGGTGMSRRDARGGDRLSRAGFGIAGVWASALLLLSGVCSQQTPNGCAP